MRRALLGVLLFAAAGCDDSWLQFHGNGANSGFRPVKTGPATRETWRVRVGRAAGKQPVIGPDGTIYVVTAELAIPPAPPQLVAVEPGGTIRWRMPLLDPLHWGSPAVAPNGDLYVITSTFTTGLGYSSRLHKVDPAGTLAWTYDYPDGGSTFASPKVWPSSEGVHVVTLLSGNQRQESLPELIIVDQDKQLLARRVVDTCHDGRPTHGAPPVDSTPAILSKPGDPEAVLVVAGLCAVEAYRWRPPDLTFLGAQDLNDQPASVSSPAAFDGGLLAVGRALAGGGGRLYAIDGITGARLWEVDTKEPIVATPASFGRQIYVPTEHHLQVVDYNGDLVASWDFDPGETADQSVGLSANLGYLVTSERLISFSFDLSRIESFPLRDSRSVAIGEDGTVYAMDGEDLVAFQD